MPIRPKLSRVLWVVAAFSCAAIFSLQFLNGAEQPVATSDKALAQLETQFSSTIKPFLESNCISCHGKDKPEAELDLTTYTNTAAVIKDSRHSLLLLERLKSEEMPPKEAKVHPSAAARRQAVDWFSGLRDYEIQRNAGDPGLVLARRLSNAEFDYTVRDLTGVDMKPTKEFPLDPTNTAGFDNSGESLTMSASLLNKYLKAAHDVADHMYLTPEGFGFGKTFMLSETDRDQFCVQQIINFYHSFNTNYVDYFRAAWQFKNRAALGKPQATLETIAAENNVSAKYLATVFSALDGAKEEVGPLAKLQAMWRQLPADANAVQVGCVAMRDYVVTTRAKVEPRFLNLAAGRVNSGTPIMMIWKNVQYATHRMTFDPQQLQVEGEPPVPPLDVANEIGAAGEFGPGRTVPVINVKGDPELVVPAGQRPVYEAAFAKFCAIFPDKFYMEERGRNYFDTSKDRGRYLSAGFHSNMGYFRDDQPLHTLILDAKQQKELDDMWFEFDFMADATARMYKEGSGGGNRQGGAAPAAGAAVAPEDLEVTSEVKVKAAEARNLTQAAGASAVGIKAVKDYFAWINSTFRTVEKTRLEAVPRQLDAMMEFAARAYRRPLTQADKDELVAYYKNAREKDGMNHEAAFRELVVLVLMSPELTYRLDLLENDKGVHALSDIDLASRLSYFLWSSMPDEELMAHAKAGDLHQPSVIAAQARRMLKDPKVRALAVEFGGNWLDFRRFQDIATVDRAHFAAFTNDLRDAMFEEPVLFQMDVYQNNRSILDFLYAKDTFVNPVLAKHYGIPNITGKNTQFTHVMDATAFDRGGILPMAAFLTKNAPGLRTSPVKRGNWVVKNVLGERIPPPPPNVPVLPQEEAKLDLPLRDVLAKHREDPSCATCHAKFDSLGLVMESFGPIGDRRQADMAGRPVDTSASFPGGSNGTGIAGLRQYIKDKRENDFVDNLCGKLLAYSLGRSLILSDEALIQSMHKKLATNGYRFDNVIEDIVTSRQFLNKRGSQE